MQTIADISARIETLESIQKHINHVHMLIECELETLMALEKMKMPPGYDGISEMEVDFDNSYSDSEVSECEPPAKRRRLESGKNAVAVSRSQSQSMHSVMFQAPA